MSTINVKITANTTEFQAALKQAGRAIQQFNDAWERSLRRQRRLRFARGWRRERLLFWRLWYRWTDWRWNRRDDAA